MKVVVLGPPDACKSVVAAHLASKFDLEHVHYRTAVGFACRSNSMLAKQMKTLHEEHTAFPVDIAFMILKTYLEVDDLRDFVLDGYPKSADEAKLLADFIKETRSQDVPNYAVVIESDAMKRQAPRLATLWCPTCAFSLPQTSTEIILDQKCMHCHQPLQERHDDTEERIQQRTERYADEIAGIKTCLESVATIVSIKMGEDIADTISHACEAIGGKEANSTSERAATLLIESLGLNLADPNIVKTPIRLVHALRDLMYGLHPKAQTEIKRHLSTVFPTHYQGIVMLDPIHCISLCSHHLFPVSYEILFGYIPADKSLGFSKIIKVVSILAAKPSLQEDFTHELIEVFQKVLEPKGIMVVVRGRHSCMTLRGERSDNTNITSAVRGLFESDLSARNEFFSLAKLAKSERSWL